MLPPPPPWARRLLPLVPWVLLIVAVLGFHDRALPADRAFDREDLREYFIPVRALLQHTVSRGEWPFWQRSIYAGFPMWGSAEMALFVPTTWLYLPWNAARALTLGSLTHLVVAALGMYAHQRYLKRSAGASLASAVLVALGGFTTAHLEHWTFSATLAPLPWTLLAIDVARARGLTPGLLLGAALGVAALWYGGAAQLAYFATLFVGGTVALYVLASRGRDWKLLLVLPAGLLLAAPVLLAGAELSAHSPRAGGMTLDWAAFYHWSSPRSLALLLFPDAYGTWRSYSGEYNYWEMTGYVGLVPLVLVLFTRPRGLGWYHLAVILLGVLASFGTLTPLYGLLFRALPGFDKLRVATRALFLVNYAAACLMAPALDALAERRPWRGVSVVLGALGLLGAALVLGQRAEALGYRADTLRANLPWTVGILAAFAAWVALRRWMKAPWVLPLGAAVLLIVDLKHTFGRYMPVSPPQALMANLPPVTPAEPGVNGRVANFGLNPNIAAGSGVEGAFGYSQLMVDRIYDLLLATHTQGFVTLSSQPLHDEYGKLSASLDSPLYPLLGAPYVIASQPSGEARPEGGRPYWSYPAPALPLAFWTRDYEVLDGERFRQEVHRFQPFQRVTVEPTLERLPAPAALPPPHAATILSRGANHTALEVTGEAPGLLMVMDPWFPGWRAEVDGQPAPVLRADYAFMAVPVSVGTHRVILRYRPTTLWAGLACVLGVLAATAGWGWRARRVVH